MLLEIQKTKNKKQKGWPAELVKDGKTFRATLIVLKDVLVQNIIRFWDIAEGKIKIGNKKATLQALVECHNNLSYACSFWNKFRITQGNNQKFMNNRLKTKDRQNLLRPIADVASNAQDMVLPSGLRGVKEWVVGLSEQRMPKS